MATKKNTGKSHETARNSASRARKRVEDPAAKYYEQSRRDREAYKAALRMVGDESSWAVESLPEHHHDFRGQEGNSRSRSSFDFSTFRSKT